MDGPQPQICWEQIWTHKVRPEGVAQGCAASINHRHADFQDAAPRIGSHQSAANPHDWAGTSSELLQTLRTPECRS